ncbi:ATP-binding protein [Desulfobacterales bacterium HSG16]|nr:ATP-binding protein [Desulfobacterales bacterium HSG16]
MTDRKKDLSILSKINELEDSFKRTDRNYLERKIDNELKNIPQLKSSKESIVNICEDIKRLFKEEYPDLKKKIMPYVEEIDVFLDKHSIEKIFMALPKYFIELHEEGTGLSEAITLIDRQIENEKLKREIEESHLALEKTKKIAYLGQMASMMAHNINNPVGIIRAEVSGALDDIEEGLFKKDELKPLFVSVRGQCQRLYNIVENFRNFARGNRQHQESVYLNELAERVSEIFSGQFRQHKIKLVLNVQTHLPEPVVNANPLQLQEVLMNLIINARDAVEGKQGACVYLKTWADERESGFCVKDNGAGLSAEQIENLFTPFVSSKPEGTGLGLYFSKEAVTRMGGSLYLDENSDGTCFVTSFPIN